MRDDFFIRHILNRDAHARREWRLPPDIDQAFVGAVCLDIQNVENYIESSFKEQFDFREDVPNAAPPMPVMWFEYTVDRRRVHCMDKSGIESNHPVDFGLLLISSQNDQGGWDCMGLAFTMDGHCHRGCFLGAIRYGVDKEGHFIVDEFNEWFYSMPGTQEIEAAMTANEKLSHTAFLVTPLVAISFMHCKNVQVIDQVLSRQVRRQMERQGSSRYVFKTLAIEPMKAAIRAESGETGDLSQRALHICRGHFKEFKEKGLFGKYKGTYWWPMHKRGDSANGVVEKDYKVHAA